MGLSPFSSSTYDDLKDMMGPRPLPNPNPKNFSIRRSEQIGPFLIVLVHYPECKNYEGLKILLYEGCTVEHLIKQGSIDPHFSGNEDFLSPIARFEPTARGTRLAHILVRALAGAKAEAKDTTP